MTSCSCRLAPSSFCPLAVTRHRHVRGILATSPLTCCSRPGQTKVFELLLAAENLALRPQLAILKQVSNPRPGWYLRFSGGTGNPLDAAHDTTRAFVHAKSSQPFSAPFATSAVQLVAAPRSLFGSLPPTVRPTGMASFSGQKSALRILYSLGISALVPPNAFWTFSSRSSHSR